VPLRGDTVPGLPPERDLTYNPRITRSDHRAGADKMRKLFGVTDEDLPDGLGWSSDEVTLTSHAGTHVDAPWHYGPLSGGKRAKTIDEIPLDWCYGDGVVLDFRHKERASMITAKDVKEATGKIQYEIKERDIVLLLTGGDKYFGTMDYIHLGIGMSEESTLFLVDKGVKIIGTDSPGFDRPFSAMAEEFKRSRDRKVILQAHYAGKIKEYCQIEKMANLDQLPPHGLKVICFPIKISKGAAAWVRAVAMIEEEK
jgi:kynurenine formamidase